MAQDEVGYIWLGTENGLSRFDGINFKNYTLEQLGLKSYISSLSTTPDGNIIFGSGSEGIFSFNPITETVRLLTKDPDIEKQSADHKGRHIDFIA
jgi:ligand-binding sensor domain-containing protein